MNETATKMNAYIGVLKSGIPSRLPADEIWSDMLRRTARPGATSEINEETYEWFRDYLPLRFFGKGGFAFAEEDADPIRFFWKGGDGRFYCRQLTREEHSMLCKLAGISLSKV